MAFPASQTIIEENHQHQQQSSSFYSEKSCGGDIENHNAGTRLGFLALRHVCSTSPCVGSSNIVSKKVKARKLTLIDSDFNDDRLQEEEMRGKSEPKSRQVRWVYSRRQRKKSLESSFDSFVEKFEVGEPKGISEAAVKSELVDDEGFVGDVLGFSNKKRRLGSSELVKLGVDSSLLCTLNGPRLRRCQDNGNGSKARIVKRKARNSFVAHWSPDECRVKKWLQYVVSLSLSNTKIFGGNYYFQCFYVRVMGTSLMHRVALDGVDPVAFVGLKCKASRQLSFCQSNTWIFFCL